MEKLQSELADTREQLAGLNARWESEKSGHNKVGDLRAQLDALRVEADKATREGDLEKASRILYGDIPSIQRSWLRLKKNADDSKAEQSETEPMVPDHVDADSIAQIVSDWTGIPVGRLMQGENEKLCIWKMSWASVLLVRKKLCVPFRMRAPFSCRYF